MEQIIKIHKLPTLVIFLFLVIPFTFGQFIILGITLASSILVLWIFTAGVVIQKKLPSPLKQSQRWFSIGLGYGLGYILLVDIHVIQPTLFSGVFHILGMIGLFYGIYFVAKNLVILEEGKPMRFDRYLGTFFLCWFFPIGIWFIQPRLRKLLDEL